MLISEFVGPSYTTDIITAALERCHGDVDAAVNNLLEPQNSRSCCNNTAGEPVLALSTATTSSQYTQSLPRPSYATNTLSISSPPGSPANTLPGPSSTCAPVQLTDFTLEDILLTHSQSTLSRRMYDLEIDRSRLWRQASIFYKKCSPLS